MKLLCLLTFITIVAATPFEQLKTDLNLEKDNQIKTTNAVSDVRSEESSWKRELAIWTHQKMKNGVGYFVKDPVATAAWVIGHPLTQSIERQMQLQSLATNCSTRTPVIACAGHGQCLPDDSCLCNDDYTTHNCDADVQCCYKKKARLGAFLLEFFLGAESGAGLWFINQNLIAGMQLMVFLLLVVFTCGKGCGEVSEDGNGGACSGCCALLMAITSLAIIGMWLACVILIGEGNIKDGNGVELSNW